MERIDPDYKADELTMLSQYLDYHRATLVSKASGLDRAAMGKRLPPSGLTLAGIVKHLALVEDNWFGVVLAGRPVAPWYADVDWEEDQDWEFRTAPDDEPDKLLALYADVCAQSRAIVAEVAAERGLDAESVTTSRRLPGEHFTLRWILLHMIEETARHNGHADLLRENADGQTGE
jgi:uncharacterized damage-inducible protein DinB